MRRFLEQHFAFAGFLGVALSRVVKSRWTSTLRWLQWRLQRAAGPLVGNAVENTGKQAAEAQVFQTVGDMPRQAVEARKGQVVYYAPGWMKSGPQS